MSILQPLSINYSSYWRQRASAAEYPQHLAAMHTLQLHNQRELSYRNQDLIKGLTAGQLSVLQSDPTFRFNHGINCFYGQNCALGRSLPHFRAIPFCPRRPKRGNRPNWQMGERGRGSDIPLLTHVVGWILDVWIRAHLSPSVLIKCSSVKSIQVRRIHSFGLPSLSPLGVSDSCINMYTAGLAEPVIYNGWWDRPSHLCWEAVTL